MSPRKKKRTRVGLAMDSSSQTTTHPQEEDSKAAKKKYRITQMYRRWHKILVSSSVLIVLDFDEFMENPVGVSKVSTIWNGFNIAKGLE